LLSPFAADHTTHIHTVIKLCCMMMAAWKADQERREAERKAEQEVNQNKRKASLKKVMAEQKAGQEKRDAE
jgi:hypothetical protein